MRSLPAAPALTVMMRFPAWRATSALVAAGAWTAVFAGWLLLRPGGELGVRAFADLATPLTAAAATVCCIAASVHFRGRRRWAWGLVAAGCAVWTLGQATSSYYQLALHDAVPFPSAADLFRLGAVPLAALGVVLLPPPRRRPVLAAQVLADSMIVAATLLWVSWALVGERVAAAAAEGSLSFAISLAYPIGDVAIVAAAVYAAGYSSRQVRPAVLTLVAGWVAFAVADSAFAYTAAVGGYQAGSLIDVVWVAGLSLVAASAAMASRQHWPAPLPNARSTAATLTVYAVVLSALLVRFLVVPLEPLTGLLYRDGVLVLVLLVVRQALANLDQRALERERQAALRALQASEVRLQQVLDHAHVSIFAFDAAGRVVLARGSAVPAPESQLGRLASEFSTDAARIIFTTALGGEESAGTFTTSEGRMLDVRCTPLWEDGELVGAVGVGLDVTDRVAASMARQESEAKDRFLAHMSHELRTPLNSILGFAQLLGRPEIGRLNERQRRYRDYIVGSGTQLLDLINDLLDLSKVRAGALDVSLDRVAVAPVVEEAVQTFGPQVGSAGVSITVEPLGDLVAEADERRLRQVLLNILSNALKFTGSGGSIRISARAAGGQVEVEIADTGIGIAEADRERIFAEFTQLDSGRARGVEGTGLGLALSRALARRMGGDLRVSGGVPVGSTFTLVLREAGSAAPAQLPDQLAEPAQPLSQV